MAWRAWTRPSGRELPAARLADLAPALLGLPDPGRALRALRDRARARRRAARPAAGNRGLHAQGKVAPGSGGGLDPGSVSAVRRRGQARGGHDGHLRRLVVVLPALL